MGGACGGEGGACGKKTTGRTGETGEGEHSAAGDASWVGEESAVGGAIDCEDREAARQMIGSDEGDSKGGVTGVDAVL